MATRRELPGQRVQIETSTILPSVGQVFASEARRRLSAAHERIQHCVNQLNDTQLWWRPSPSMNSIANLMLHLCGNIGQWLVSGVGGADDTRNRPQEFAERGPVAKDELLRRLEAVVALADEALLRLDDERLLETKRIQGFEGTVLALVFDCLAHVSGHAQEIVYVTRLHLGDAYRFAWVPGTPEQVAAAPKETETVALRDAVFGEMSGHPLPTDVPAGGQVVNLPPLKAPLDDYLLALEQEFQEDEEKGKL